MLGAAKTLLKARYATSALAALGVYQVYSYVAPAALPPDEKVRAANEATAVVAAAMPDEWRRKKVLIFPFASDATGCVTEAMVGAVTRLDRAEPVPLPRAETVLSLVKRFVGTGTAGADAEGEALRIAADAQAEILVLGRVRELSLKDDVPKASLSVKAVEVKTGRTLWTKDVEWMPPFLERTVGRMSPMRRAIGWVLFVLIIPWACLPIMKGILQKESNAVNAGVLVFFTAVAVALAYVALAGQLDGWAGAFFLLAVAFGFLYNAAVLNHLAGFFH